MGIGFVTKLVLLQGAGQEDKYSISRVIVRVCLYLPVEGFRRFNPLKTTRHGFFSNPSMLKTAFVFHMSPHARQSS